MLLRAPLLGAEASQCQGWWKTVSTWGTPSTTSRGREHLGVLEACTPPGISPPITSTSSQATGYGNRVPASRPPHGPHDGTLPVLAPFSPPDTKTTFSWLRYDLEQFGKWHLCKQN